MLQPYPIPLRLRARAQSNPSRPKCSGQAPTSDTTRDLGSDPASRPDTAAAGPSPQPSPRPLTAGPLAPVAAFAPPEKKHTKKLQRPRRGSLFASTSSVQLVPSSSSVPPSPNPSESRQVSPQPPPRPPRNPARIHLSDAIRPSSSSGARDHKAIWDPPTAGPSESSTFPYSSSPLLNKLVRRNRSVSANVNGLGDGRPGSAGVGSSAGSLLTKAGRAERRERDREMERSADSERSFFSRKHGDMERDLKGKGKEKEEQDDSPTPRERAAQPSAALAHAYAYVSASLTPPSSPKPTSSSASLVQPRRASKLHANPHSRPHSQTIAPPLSQTPRSANVSRDSHSSNSTSSNSNPSDLSGAQVSAPKGKEREKALPGFSTLDRTILEELKHSITARESQFVFKGPGCGLGQNGEKGTRHHPFMKEEVPYPRSYDKGVVDLDVWESAWIQQMCDSVTWHVFETPPTKVLDLGCGTGSWVLECAKRWKQCHFVGLDLVPLQPDLRRVCSSSTASRITWVQANFLEGLPFPNEEFDFVHIKRIARGVPEDKWDTLFDEVTRVMKPGGAFEMLEEDLYWPGKPRDADGDSDSEPGSSPSSTSSTKVPSSLVGSPTDTSARSESPSTPRPTIRKNTTPPTDTTEPTPGPAPHRPPSPKSLFHAPPTKVSAPPSTPGHAHGRPPALTISTMLSTPSRATVNNAVAEGNIPSESSRPSASTHSTSSSSTPSRTPHWHRRTSFSPSTPSTSVSMSPEFSQFSPVRPSFSYPHLVRTAPKPPVNPRDHTILETIYTEMHAMRFINLAPLSLLPNNLSTWFKDVRTHPPLNITFPPPPVHPRVRSSLARPDAFSALQTGSDDESGFSDLEGSPVRVETRGLKFRRTHSAEDSQTTIRRKSLTPTTEKPASSPIISLQGLMLGVSPYAYLDNVRFTAFPPSGKASFVSLHSEPSSVRDMLPAADPKPTSASTEQQNSSQDSEAPAHDAIMKTLASLEGLPLTSVPVPSSQSAEGVAQDLAATLANFKIRLPNTMLRLDLRTLNLHLAARTSEILACAEAMWEWVLEFQAEKTQWKQNPRSKSNRVDHSASKLTASQAGKPEDPTKVAITELTRTEFDGLLTQFNLDMRDQYALESALEERFAWSVVPMPVTQDRKLFDIACDKWDQYQRQQDQDQTVEPQYHPYRRHSHQSQLLSDTAPTLSHLPTIPDTVTMRKDGTRPTISFTEVPGAVQLNLSRNNSSPRGGRQTLPHTGSYASLRKERAPSEPLDDPHPSHFLCRTIRVFVAWKP